MPIKFTWGDLSTKARQEIEETLCAEEDELKIQLRCACSKSTLEIRIVKTGALEIKIEMFVCCNSCKKGAKLNYPMISK